MVDDCSRATWIYLLTHKSHAFHVMKIFCAYVQNQFDTTIKVVRSDNALEFGSGPTGAYFEQHGIVHWTSYVDRPQHNDRVERKHRHVLEIARAL